MNTKYINEFIDLVNEQPDLPRISADDFAPGRTRVELGVSSLAVIMLLVEYLTKKSPGREFDPDWVPELETLEGIVSTMEKIDAN